MDLRRMWCHFSRPYGRKPFAIHPGVETPGYYRASLRTPDTDKELLPQSPSYGAIGTSESSPPLQWRVDSQHDARGVGTPQRRLAIEVRLAQHGYPGSVRLTEVVKNQRIPRESPAEATVVERENTEAPAQQTQVGDRGRGQSRR